MIKSLRHINCRANFEHVFVVTYDLLVRLHWYLCKCTRGSGRASHFYTTSYSTLRATLIKSNPVWMGLKFNMDIYRQVDSWRYALEFPPINAQSFTALAVLTTRMLCVINREWTETPVLRVLWRLLSAAEQAPPTKQTGWSLCLNFRLCKTHCDSRTVTVCYCSLCITWNIMPLMKHNVITCRFNQLRFSLPGGIDKESRARVSYLRPGGIAHR